MSKRNSREAKRLRREAQSLEEKSLEHYENLCSLSWDEKKKSANDLISAILCQTRSIDKLPDGVLNAINQYHDLAPLRLRNRITDIDMAQTIVEIDCFGGTASWGWETKEHSEARTHEGFAGFVRSLNPVHRPTTLEVLEKMWQKKSPSFKERFRNRPDYVWHPT